MKDRDDKPSKDTDPLRKVGLIMHLCQLRKSEEPLEEVMGFVACVCESSGGVSQGRASLGN